MKKNSFVGSFYAARRKQKCFNYVYRLLKIVLDKVKTKKYSNHTKKNWAVILVIINQLSNKIIIKVLKIFKIWIFNKRLQHQWSLQQLTEWYLWDIDQDEECRSEDLLCLVFERKDGKIKYNELYMLLPESGTMMHKCHHQTSF